jgi:uncharacterized membrane protein HdeD (DUF308 family)
MDEQSRRKRVVWLSAIANLTLIIMLGAVWFQRALTAQIMAILTLGVMLIVNGALWLGFRIEQARRRANRPLKPLVFFIVGGFMAIVAILEIASTDYASAGMLLMCSVGVVGLGVITTRNAKKKDAGPER